jgi:uncharacterized membrane protein
MLAPRSSLPIFQKQLGLPLTKLPAACMGRCVSVYGIASPSHQKPEHSVTIQRMPPSLVSIGRAFFALGIIGIGIEHFIFHEFIPVIVPAFPASMPGRSVWVYAVGALLVLGGLSILLNIRARTVAIALGAVLLILVLIGHIPSVLAAYPKQLGSWTNAFKALTLCGGAWVAAGSLSRYSSARPSGLERFMTLGKYFLALTVVTFGIDHLLYTDFVATLVPAWIPGHYVWTYFAAGALILSGLAMILNIQSRLAALLLGVMIFLWFLMLHIPRAIADPTGQIGNEVTSVFEALAFSGIAFMLAALPVSNPFSISAKQARAAHA